MPGRTTFIPFLTLSAAAARAHGLTVIDRVFNDLEDAEGLMADCRQAAAMGFDGKTLVHPRQIEPCNEVSSPTADEWARRIVTAFEQPEMPDMARSASRPGCLSASISSKRNTRLR